MADSDMIRGIVHIQCPLPEVFAFIADYRNDPAWRKEVRSVKYTTPEPVAAAGSQCVEIARILGRQRETWLEVTRCEKDAGIASVTFHASVPHASERAVRQSGEGTALEYRIQYDNGQAWMRRFLRPMRRGAETRRLIRALAKLKQLLENRRISDPRNGGLS